MEKTIYSLWNTEMQLQKKNYPVHNQYKLGGHYTFDGRDDTDV